MLRNDEAEKKKEKIKMGESQENMEEGAVRVEKGNLVKRKKKRNCCYRS